MDFNPALLQQLIYEDTNHIDEELPSFKIRALSSSILKKYVPLNHQKSLETAAIEDFLERNTSMQNTFVIPDGFHHIFHLWRDILHRIFLSGEWQSNVLTLDSSLAYAYAGPGASVGTKSTDFLGKMFNSDLTTTTLCLYRHYVNSISPRWLKAESIRSACHSTRIVEGSKLSSVPKDSTRNRTICTEPSLNMFYQLGAKHIIENLVAKFYHIYMDDQPEINKNLARFASITDVLSTIDMKNASDSIHLDLLRYLLPASTFSTLNILRSRYTVVNGQKHELNMISTMGNGFTFPLMTLLFCSLSQAVASTRGISLYNAVNFGVFGDDIILPSKDISYFVDAFEAAGFEVNLSKSFITGPFRESCGGDYYKGHDVRGIYLKELRNEQQLYSVFNRLHRWSLRHCIPLNRTLLYLKGLARFRPIPFDEADDGGFKVSRNQLTSAKRDLNGAIIYHCFVKSSRYYKVGDSHPNPDGCLIAAVGGYVRGHNVSIRSNTDSYVVVKRKTPRWDFLSDPVILLQDYDESWRSLLRDAG